jgi:hypothetical protein
MTLSPFTSSQLLRRTINQIPQIEGYLQSAKKLSLKFGKVENCNMSQYSMQPSFSHQDFEASNLQRLFNNPDDQPDDNQKGNPENSLDNNSDDCPDDNTDNNTDDTQMTTQMTVQMTSHPR